MVSLEFTIQTEGISVIVPVGNTPSRNWLGECLRSIIAQEMPENVGLEIVVIDDGAQVLVSDVTLIKNPCRLGQAASLNIGVCAAMFDLVYIMGGCDDELLPGCLKACYEMYDEQHEPRALYSPTIETSSGEISSIAQGTYLFHKDVFNYLGGWPPESGAGEVDAMFQSIALKAGIKFFDVLPEVPLYWHREHAGALSATKSADRATALGLLRGVVTQEWQPK